ncbi:MAG: trypsin-like peptidase domain-containing protein [Terriglobales bacterium]
MSMAMFPIRARRMVLGLAVAAAAVAGWGSMARSEAGAVSEANLDAPALLHKVAGFMYTVRALDVHGHVHALGSGVQVRGLGIISSLHVIEGASVVQVERAGVRQRAAVVRIDRSQDICLLLAGEIPTEGVERGTEVQPGQRVYAVGSPEGLSLIISEGLLSGVRQVLGSAMLVFSAPISEGSSGGGLFDASGHLLGVTTAQIANGDDLGLAVPVSQIAPLSTSDGKRFRAHTAPL